jgi:hypothetical protein
MNAAAGEFAPRPSAPASRVRAFVIDIVLNVVLPYAGYAALRQFGQTEDRALLLSAVIPAAVAVASIIQRRRMNALSILVVVATLLGLGGTALSGSVWFTLIRPSFVTFILAIVFAASLAAERPTLFYLARDTTCPTAAEATAFEANWVRPGFRRAMRRLTIVWAAFLFGEAVLRCVIAAIWPNPTLVAATQILWIVLPILLVRWSIKAGRRWGTAA